MTGDVNLRDAFCRNAAHIIQRIEAMILRRHIDIVHIEQDAAVRRLDNLIQKLPLGHLGLVKLRIAAHIFDATGISRKSCTSRIRAAVVLMASNVYGRGSRSCV